VEIALRVGEEGPRVRVYARNPGPRPLVGRQTGKTGAKMTAGFWTWRTPLLIAVL